jgi:hypothetical protein
MKMDSSDLFPERDRRRGYMIVYYPARRNFYQRFINWLERKTTEKNG